LAFGSGSLDDRGIVFYILLGTMSLHRLQDRRFLILRKNRYDDLYCEQGIKALGVHFMGAIKMLGLLRKRSYPIGVDMQNQSVKLVQLGDNGKGVSLVAAGMKNRPAEIKPGSSQWQRWAIDTIKKLTAEGGFRGRNVVGAIPANDVFIDNLRMPGSSGGTIEEAVFPRIKQKLPFSPEDAIIKCIATEENNVVVMATDKQKINRHLAIYEKASLRIKSIDVWPTALVASYAKFFGRRSSDRQAVVMLIEIEQERSNLVICRHKNPLFARSIPIGSESLDCDDGIKRLVSKISGCKVNFRAMYKNVDIERLIFLTGQNVERRICMTIAKKAEMPAQVGDCLAALNGENTVELGIDRRNSAENWTTAFGLSSLRN